MLVDGQYSSARNLSFLESGRFSRPRLLGDIVGFLVASYVIAVVVYVIDNTSHTPSKFSHLSVLVLAAVFAATTYPISRRFGNTRYFGLKTVLASSLVGSLSAAVLFVVTDTIVHGSSTLTDSGFGLIPFMAYALIAFPTAMLVRLLSTPVVNIFEPPYESFKIPRS